MFFEVFVCVALDVAEARDRKGLSSLARQGAIRQFPGLESTYETPVLPRLHVRTVAASPVECVHAIITKLPLTGCCRYWPGHPRIRPRPSTSSASARTNRLPRTPSPASSPGPAFARKLPSAAPPLRPAPCAPAPSPRTCDAAPPTPRRSHPPLRTTAPPPSTGR
ncbi:adenylyl-sulfate kinase, partial [Burkholderia cenocepacia]|uniref:adenylyl-sulfate kinase n=1 Tax=Burkholderia cenocepacia TaxID=95486 RepID=UPI00406C8319